jgi:hypothetical protein
MSPEVGDEVEQRLARLEQTEQRLARALELLERQSARPRRNWDVYAAVIASLMAPSPSPSLRTPPMSSASSCARRSGRTCASDSPTWS